MATRPAVTNTPAPPTAMSVVLSEASSSSCGVRNEVGLVSYATQLASEVALWQTTWASQSIAVHFVKGSTWQPPLLSLQGLTQSSPQLDYTVSGPKRQRLTWRSSINRSSILSPIVTSSTVAVCSVSDIICKAKAKSMLKQNVPSYPGFLDTNVWKPMALISVGGRIIIINRVSPRNSFIVRGRFFFITI